MEKIKQFLEKCDQPLTEEQLKRIIYNVFCIFIFLSPIIPDQLGFGIYSLKYTVFNITVIMTSFLLFIINRKDLKINVYDIILVIYFLFVVLSTIFTQYNIGKCILGTNGRGEGLITIFSYIATFIICSKGYKYIIKNYKIAMVGALIICIYSIIQANAPLEIDLPFGNTDVLGVAEATMGNQNFLASYICIFLPMICYYFLNTKENKSLILIALMFITLVFTKTLNGYTVFTIMYILIAIFSLYYGKDKEEILLKFLVMTLLFVLLFMSITFVKGDMYWEELRGVGRETVNLLNGEEEFATGRLRIWRRVLMAIDNNKFFGVGPDSLKLEFLKKEYHILGDKDVLSSIYVDKAHCEYLHIAVTTGIPSLILYVIFVLMICVRLWKITFRVNKEETNRADKMFITLTLIGILSYLSQAIGNISVIQVAPVFWTILGLGAGIVLHEKTDRKNRN